MVIQIPLSKKGKHAGKYVAIIDDCDADLAEFNWTVQCSNKIKYAYKRMPKDRITMFFLHRIIVSRFAKITEYDYVDHIDGNGLNNQRSNLRVATQSQNMMNKKRGKNNTSGYKGVSWHKWAGKYRAQIKYNGKVIHLGHFSTPEDAYAAYCKKAKEIFGEFWNSGTN